MIRPAPVDAAILRGERDARNRALAVQLPRLAIGLTLLWLAISAGHAGVLSGNIRDWMLGLSLATSGILAALWWMLRRHEPLPPQFAHPVGATMALLLALNSVLHLLLSADLKQSSNLALLIVAIGCYVTSMRWMVGLGVLILAAWGVVLARIPAQAEWLHYAFMMFIASALALLVVRSQSRLIVSNHHAAEAQARQTEAFRSQSLTDALTGLANRRALEEALRREWERAARAAAPLAVLVIDADRFKRYNDHFGHLAGDECLRRIATILGQSIRGMDMAGRYGGEEFVLLLPNADVARALVVAERARAAIESAGIAHVKDRPGDPHFVSVSIGVAATVPSGTDTAEALIARADEALYRAKSMGRNRCELHTSPGKPD